MVWNRLRIWVNRHVVWFGLVPEDGRLVWGGLAGYIINVTVVDAFVGRTYQRRKKEATAAEV